MWDPSLPAVRPRYPDRVKAFVYGCGKAAAIMDQKMKNSRLPEVSRSRPPVEKGLVLPRGVRDPRGGG